MAGNEGSVIVIFSLRVIDVWARSYDKLLYKCVGVGVCLCV